MWGGKMKKYLLLVILLLLSLSTVSALSASIGNAKMILRQNITTGQANVIEKSILVRNINNESVIVELKPMEDMESLVTLKETEFMLQPNESRNAQFNITIYNPGTYRGNIGVSFKPENAGKTESGVGLLSNIVVIANEVAKAPQQQENTGNFPIIVVAGIIVLALIILAIIMLRKK